MTCRFVDKQVTRQNGACPDKAQITILYDAFGKDSAMQRDWGYAALVEYGGKRILFDSGNNPEILAQNVRAKHIDLSKLDFVVISHHHGDHMGGLAYLLRVNPNVKIYAPKEGFGGVFGSDSPSSFYRKDPSLSPEQRYYGGAPPDVMHFGSAWPGANFQLVDKTVEIASDIHLISVVSDKAGTLELREVSLAINTPEGLVLVVGCGHPGIDKIVEAASTINPRIHLVVHRGCLGENLLFGHCRQQPCFRNAYYPLLAQLRSVLSKVRDKFSEKLRRFFVTLALWRGQATLSFCHS